MADLRRRVEDIGRREQAEVGGLPDHVDLEPVAHAGLFEVRAERAVDQADGREVLHAGEPGVDDLVGGIRP